MDRREVEKTVFAVVAASVPEGARGKVLGVEVSLRRDLGLDSLGLLALLNRVAEALGTDPDELLEAVAETRVATVGDVVALGERLALRASGA
jgi:acyl carrier protein